MDSINLSKIMEYILQTVSSRYYLTLKPQAQFQFFS